MVSSSFCLLNTGDLDLVPKGQELGESRDCHNLLEKIQSLVFEGNSTPIPSLTFPLPCHYTSWAIPDNIVKNNAKKINYTSLRYPVIFSSHLLINFTNGAFHWRFPTKTQCTFLILRASRSVYFILNFITQLIIPDGGKKSLYYWISPASSYWLLLRSKYFLQHTPILCSSFNVR